MSELVVLCVDDEPIVLDSLKIELRKVLGKRCAIEVADGGEEALGLLEELNADGVEVAVMLCDYIMPGMRGDKVLKEFHARSPKTLNIMLTGQADLQAVSAAIRDAKLYRYIAKPWQPDDLQLTVTEAVRSYRQDKALAEQYALLERSNRDLAELNRTLEQKVAARTEQLSAALQNLQATQGELIQQEKMAALGQLIAGVAHEINTPLGVIQGANAGSAKALQEALSQLPEVTQRLSVSRQTEFSALLARSLRADQVLNAKDKRLARRSLETQLEAHGIAEPAYVADTLVDMGIVQDADPFVALLKDPEAKRVLQTAYNLAILARTHRHIELAVKRAAKIVFALRKYAHFDHNDKPVVVRIDESIETVLTLYQHQLKHGVEVKRDYQDIPPTLGYPDELHQVWTNLIHNALQAMHGHGQLCLGLRSIEGRIVVSITDSGEGVAEAAKERLFEPFFTTKPAGEGSGLGLDICRKIVEKHAGTITVTSEPGRTRFEVSLPVDPA